MDHSNIMDHSKALVKLLQNAELKAKMSLYYMQQSNEYISKEEHTNVRVSNGTEIKDLYNSSQIYCKNLEKQLREKSEELQSTQFKSEEAARHNEAMLEELDILNKRLERYPKTIQQLRAEIEKLSNKIYMLEEQKKYMEQQATQNEGKVQHSQQIQQDLIQSQNYIARLQRHLDSSNAAEGAPVLMTDKCVQTAPDDSESSTKKLEQTREQLTTHHSAIRRIRSDVSDLRSSCTEFKTISDDIVKLKDVVSGIAQNKGNHGNGKRYHSNPVLFPIHLLLNVERVEVVARVLPPDSDQTLTTYTSNTSNTALILKDNNNVTTYTLDLVTPINAPHQQVVRSATRACQLLTQERSVLIVMVGESDLTLYGTTETHGIIAHLLKVLLSIKEKEDSLTVSVGTFLKNQMCDGLSEFSVGDGKVTAVPITSHEQGSQLLSQADIPDSSDHVLHQFTLRCEGSESRSVSILETETVDTDSSELLRDYRATGRVAKASKPNVLYDTIHAYMVKEGSITVYLNLRPDLSSLTETTRLLSTAGTITATEPVQQAKKRGLFSFR